MGLFLFDGYQNIMAIASSTLTFAFCTHQKLIMPGLAAEWCGRRGRKMW